MKLSLMVYFDQGIIAIESNDSEWNIFINYKSEREIIHYLSGVRTPVTSSVNNF